MSHKPSAPIAEINIPEIAEPSPVSPARTSATNSSVSPPTPHSILSNVALLRETLLPSRQAAAVEIQRLLHAESKGQEVVTLWVRGAPGCGKQGLIRSLRTNASAEYDVLWLVRARHATLVAQDFADLAVTLQVATREEAIIRPQVCAVRALRWLSGNPRVLYVFSGATAAGGPRSIDPWLQHITSGQVICTGECESHLPSAPVFDVPPVPLGEALTLLEWDNSESGELCAKAMGSSLLALRLARSFHHHGLMTQGMVAKAVHQSLKRNQNPAAGLIAQLVRDLKQSSPHIVDVLSLLSFFSSDGFDLSLLDAEKTDLPGALSSLFSPDSDPTLLLDVVSLLERWSLLQQRDGLIFLHPFVQHAILETLPQERRPLFAIAALSVMTASFTFDRERPNDWVNAVRLFPHVLASIAVCQRISGAAAHLAQLEYRVANYLHAMQQGQHALLYAQESLGRRLVTLGEDSIAVVDSYRQCGQLEQERGNWLGACHDYEKAVGILQEMFPESNNLQIIEPLTALAMTLAKMGQSNRARSLSERALSIAVQVAETDSHPCVARALAGYATVLRLIGAGSETLACTNRAISIWEQVAHTTDPTSAARSLADWGAELLRDGDSDTAIRALRLVFTLAQNTLDPSFQSSVNRNLGVALFVRGKFAEARVRLEQALEQLRAAGTPGRRYETVPILWELARISRTIGDHVTARTYLDRALDLQTRALPEQRHPDFAVTYYELGVTHMALTNPNAARQCLTRAMDIHRRFLLPGHNDLQTALILHELAYALLSNGELDTARSHYEQALEIKITHHESKDHPDVALTESMLGQLLWKLGQKDRARELLQHAEWVFSAQYGPDHPKAVSLQRMLNTIR